LGHFFSCFPTGLINIFKNNFFHLKSFFKIIFIFKISGRFNFPEHEWSDVSDGAKDLIRGLLVKEAPKRLSAERVLSHTWTKMADDDSIDSKAQAQRRRALKTPGVIRRNQSARELSQFAESAMAVKRVILQHFSMHYDYMRKERPNIYEPTPNINVNNHQDSLDDSKSSEGSSSLDGPKRQQQQGVANNEQQYSSSENPSTSSYSNSTSSSSSFATSISPNFIKASSPTLVVTPPTDNNTIMSKSSSNSSSNPSPFTTRIKRISRQEMSNPLDSIIELKEKLPVVEKPAMTNNSNPYRVKSYSADTNKYRERNNHRMDGNCDKILPEQSWRYKSNDSYERPIYVAPAKNYHNRGNNYSSNSGGYNNNHRNQQWSNGNYNRQPQHQQQQPSPSYRHQYSPNSNNYTSKSHNDIRTNGGIDIRRNSWRDECGGRLINNNNTNNTTKRPTFIMQQQQKIPTFYFNSKDSNSDSNNSCSSDSDSAMGLSPPIESSLMQRRLKMSSVN
jgi:MAP kinase interacting serine/threonine kinase